MNVRLLTRENLLIWPLVVTGALITANAAVTGNKILFTPLVLLGFWGWIRFATKYPSAALIIIIFFAENCFDIFTFGIRRRLLSDIGLAMMIPLIVLHFRRVWNHFARDRSPYAIAIFLFFSAILISLYFGSHVTFGQPMVTGLTVARKYLLFCSYFFMVAVGASREECFRFMKYLAWLGAAIAFLSIIEVALGGGIIFSHYYDVGQERAGLLRIHVGTFLIVYSVVYFFIRYPHLPQLSKERLPYLLMLGMGLFAIGFIAMTRAVILGLAVTFALWLIRKLSSKRIMFACVTISTITIIMLSGLGETILSKTFVGEIIEQTAIELGSDKGNISIRKKGAQYYMDLMLDNAPLTGVGIFSDTNYPNNPVTIAGELHHYYLIDSNGITTFVHFGILGALLLAFFVISSLRDSFMFFRHDKCFENYNFEILFFIFIYTLATPTLNNIIVERMLVYSGVFFYLLSKTNINSTNRIKSS